LDRQDRSVELDRSLSGLTVETFRGDMAVPAVDAALPHARVTVLLDVGDGAGVVAGVPLRAVVIGLQVQPTLFALRGRTDCVEVRLLPSLARQAGLDVGGLAHAVVPVDRLFGCSADALANRLLGTEPDERPVMVAALLRSEIQRREPDRVALTLQTLERADSDLNVGSVVELVGGSRSRLWRHVDDAIGMSPREYLSLRRFERSQRLVASGLALAASAAQAGYVDQSHFHRHVRRYAGLTPSALRARLIATSVQDAASGGEE
jgi:AraC-like DNA-binding protein